MRAFLEATVRHVGDQAEEAFAVRFADGREYRNRHGEPAFILVFRTARAQWRSGTFGHVGMLESYFDGELDIEGDLAHALAVGMCAGYDAPNPLVGVRNRWHELRFSNASRARAKANARFHYALGTEFYRLWLDDPLMMYTCAYWNEGTHSLEEAQRAKIEHVARKLQLGPADHAVDIGCGFGGFMFHAHEHFGARLTGINTTTEQVEAVRREIARRGLGGKLDVIEADMRDADRAYDKVVSIGVLEHAGRNQLGAVVRAHARFLRPGGLGVLHFIGHIGSTQTEFFIRKHVFPGGWIPSLAEALVELERAGLEVLDVENLRRHYALTLDAWAERFDRNWERIRALDARRFDERFRRVWRTYLYGCAEVFRLSTGRTHLFQVVFSRGNVSRRSYPMSRAFLYSAHPPAASAPAAVARPACGARPPRSAS